MLFCDFICMRASAVYHTYTDTCYICTYVYYLYTCIIYSFIELNDFQMSAATAAVQASEAQTVVLDTCNTLQLDKLEVSRHCRWITIHTYSFKYGYTKESQTV